MVRQFVKRYPANEQLIVRDRQTVLERYQSWSIYGVILAIILLTIAVRVVGLDNDLPLLYN